MSTSHILLGSGEFMSELEKQALHARDSFLAQAMTFEGDEAGKWLIDVMLSSPARQKKLLIDSYSRLVINDHFIPSIKYLKDPNFRKEVKNTRALIKHARDHGIEVKFTNPLGFLGVKYPLRNHKKMVILDEKTSFLGGINFSDHNFAWHDMMVQVADAELSRQLVADFAQTWAGHNQSLVKKTDTGSLYLFNGAKSTSLYDSFFERIKAAKESVQILSPYISEPLLGVLRSVADNEVKITIISPRENNKSIFKSIILSEQEKGYFDLKEYPGMSHMKAILVDGETFIFGSSNYDLVSYFFEQEVVFVSEEQALIRQFQKRILQNVEEVHMENVSQFEKRKADMLMSLLNHVGRLLSGSILRPH